MSDNITPAELAAWRALCEATLYGDPMEYVIDLSWRQDGDHVIQHVESGQVVIRQRCNPENPPFDDMLARYYRLFAASREAFPRLLDEITRLQAECDRMEKRLDGHGHCGICGALLPNDMLRHGVLGDDAGWVCDDCIEEAEGESK